MKVKNRLTQVPLGLPADEVLRRVKRPKRTRHLGLDPDLRSWMNGMQGKVFEWEYSWGVLVFKRRRADDDGHGPHCYRVVEKRAK